MITHTLPYLTNGTQNYSRLLRRMTRDYRKDSDETDIASGQGDLRALECLTTACMSALSLARGASSAVAHTRGLSPCVNNVKRLAPTMPGGGSNISGGRGLCLCLDFLLVFMITCE